MWPFGRKYSGSKPQAPDKVVTEPQCVIEYVCAGCGKPIDDRYAERVIISGEYLHRGPEGKPCMEIYALEHGKVRVISDFVFLG